MRLRGLKSMTMLLKTKNLLPSIQYYLINGWQGLVRFEQTRQHPTLHCMDGISLIPPSERAQVS